MNSNLITIAGDYCAYASLSGKSTKRSVERSKHWGDISHSLQAKPNNTLSDIFQDSPTYHMRTN